MGVSKLVKFVVHLIEVLLLIWHDFAPVNLCQSQV